MKNKIIELIDALREELAPNAYIKIANAIQSLPDDEPRAEEGSFYRIAQQYGLTVDQPDLLPFEWPVKEGYEVVTRDGRKVEQLHKFNVPAYCIYGVVDDRPIAWTIEGFATVGKSTDSDLFLRRLEKKVWVVEWEGIWDACAEKPDPNPNAKIYEATLKPVK